MSDSIAKPGEREQSHYQDELIDGYHKHCGRAVYAQVLGNRGQRDRGDRTVDHDQRGSEGDRADGQIKAWRGQAVAQKEAPGRRGRRLIPGASGCRLTAHSPPQPAEAGQRG